MINRVMFELKSLSRIAIEKEYGIADEEEEISEEEFYEIN